MENPYLVKHAAAVGFFFIILYFACLFWRFTITEPAVMQFHLLALKTAFPGFQGFDGGSMVWGAVLSFVYGFIFSFVFHAFHRGCCKLGGK